jgi:outer membrane biosynthesis protein TonB
MSDRDFPDELPSDPSNDDENLNSEDRNSAKIPEPISVPTDVPHLRLPTEGAQIPADGPDEELSENAFSDQVPLEEIPELDRDDLKVDTLEFERINRRAKPKRGGLKFLLIVIILGGGYAAWTQWGDEILGRNADELPIVRASESPSKVRPEKPGGIEIPNRDKLVYDRLEKKPPEQKTENLLPRPEVPLTPSAPKPVDKAETTPGPVSAPPKEVKAEPEAKREISKTVGSQPTTEEVKTVKKPEPAPAPPKIENKIAKVEVKTPAPAAAPAVISKTSYQVQLVAVRNEAAAKREWTRLQKKYSGLLGQLTLNVVRADLGKKGIFYRLRAGPLADREAAKTLCQSLAKIKVGCLAIRPGR